MTSEIYAKKRNMNYTKRNKKKWGMESGNRSNVYDNWDVWIFAKRIEKRI